MAVLYFLLCCFVDVDRTVVVFVKIIEFVFVPFGGHPDRQRLICFSLFVVFCFAARCGWCVWIVSIRRKKKEHFCQRRRLLFTLLLLLSSLDGTITLLSGGRKETATTTTTKKTERNTLLVVVAKRMKKKTGGDGSQSFFNNKFFLQTPEGIRPTCTISNPLR